MKEENCTSSLAGRMMSLKYTCVLFSGVVAKSGGGKLKSRPSGKPSNESLAQRRRFPISSTSYQACKDRFDAMMFRS